MSSDSVGQSADLRTRIAAVLADAVAADDSIVKVQYGAGATSHIVVDCNPLADAVIRELDAELRTVRLLAWARDCVLNGDMTPSAERVLGRILAGHND